MNIFAIEGEGNQIDWVKSAKSLDNYRVVKMILESTQMICTTINIQHDKQITPYKNAHVNHPSTIWTRTSSANFNCLLKHTESMLEEYTERFGKEHKCKSVIFKALKHYDRSLFDLHEETVLPLCMDNQYKGDTVVESYRRFYSDKPRMRYPKDKIPQWFIELRTKDFQTI